MKAHALVAGVCLALCFAGGASAEEYDDYGDFDPEMEYAMEAMGKAKMNPNYKPHRPLMDHKKILDPEHPEYDPERKVSFKELQWLEAELKLQELEEHNAKRDAEFVAEEIRKASLRPVTLTPDELISARSGMKSVFVEFFAPWCGHCKRLEPTWDEVAETVAKDRKLNKCVTIAKLDADYYKQFGVEQQVKSFPTIKWYNTGVTGGTPGGTIKYNGGHDTESILAFIRTQCSTRAGMRIFAFDALAVQFTAAESEDAAHAARASLQAAADRVPEGMQRPAADMYLKVADDAIAAGRFPPTRYLKANLAQLEDKISTPMDVDLGDFDVDEGILRAQIITGFINGPEQSWTP